MRAFVFELIPPFVVGGIGWLGLEFVARHLSRFYELRRGIHKALIYHANVSSDRFEPSRQNAMDKFRQLAAEGESLDASLSHGQAGGIWRGCGITIYREPPKR
jgi:hypothetical protein